MLLQDNVCVIVGAGSVRGIGYATAELFAEHGAKVVAVDLAMDQTLLASIRSSIEQRLQRSVPIDGIRCDIANAADCERLTQEVLARLEAHATEERFIYRHRWRPSDVLMWDNRCLLHRADPNFDAALYPRVLHRTCLRGTAPG